MAGRMERLKFTLGFSGCLVVDCEGRSGGLVLFWRRESDLEILFYSKNHFDTCVYDMHKDLRFHVTVVYGYPVASKRRDVWRLIKLLSTRV